MINRTQNRSKAIIGQAVAIAMLGMAVSTQAATYTWVGHANDGIWQNGATASDANWLVDGVEGVYEPSNGGSNNFVIAGTGYNADVNTINLYHDPNVTNLSLNNTATTPINIVINEGAHLDFNIATTPSESLSVGGGAGGANVGHEISAVGNGYVMLQGNDVHQWRVSGSTGRLTVSAPIHGSGVRRGIEKRGDGNLRLTATNSIYSGQTTIAGGRIEVTSLKNMGLESSLGTHTRYGIVQIGSTSGLSGTLNYIGTEDTTTDARFNIGRHTGDPANTAQITRLLSESGTLTLTGGLVANEGGLFSHNVNFELGGDGDININARGTDRTYFGDREGGIFGGINLNKVGTGTVRINTQSLWRGATTVSAGSLLVNINHTINSGMSNYTVLEGGTLGGTGSINSPISIETGGNLRPGDAGGVLTTNNTLDLAGAFIADLYSTSDFSQLLANNSVTLAETATLEIGEIGDLLVGDMFTIIDTPGTLVGTFAGLTDGSSFISGLHTFQIGYSNGDVSLTLTDIAAVPEPTTFGLLSIAGLGLLARRRRMAK